METAGKLVDDDELREAMKESGIGTPATRAAIIERLITVGYVERDGRALVATEKGLNVIRLLGEHALTSPGLTGSWEQRLGKIERGEDSRKEFMSDIAGFATETVKTLDETLKDVRIPRARLGPCPVCGHEIVENRKGYSCWDREDPGCGFVIWKAKAGKTLPVAIARELIKKGYTAQAVTGFRGRSGRSFRAHLALQQTDEGKWRVEFDEPWAREGAKPPEVEGEAAAAAAPAAPRPWPSRAPPERLAGARRVGPVRQDGPMGITLVTGPANAGKAEVVMDAVRRHLARGQRTVARRADPDRRRVLPARAGRRRGGDGGARDGLRRPGRGARRAGRRSRARARRARPRAADRIARRSGAPGRPPRPAARGR